MKRKAILFAIVLAVAASGIVARALFPPKPTNHHVVLTWNAVPPTQGTPVGGYNIYRSTMSGGPYIKIASRVASLMYDDRAVNSGNTYFYVVTSVDRRNLESRYSTEVRAAVP